MGRLLGLQVQLVGARSRDGRELFLQRGHDGSRNTELQKNILYSMGFGRSKEKLGT